MFDESNQFENSFITHILKLLTDQLNHASQCREEHPNDIISLSDFVLGKSSSMLSSSHHNNNDPCLVQNSCLDSFQLLTENYNNNNQTSTCKTENLTSNEHYDVVHSILEQY